MFTIIIICLLLAYVLAAYLPTSRTRERHANEDIHTMKTWLEAGA